MPSSQEPGPKGRKKAGPKSAIPKPTVASGNGEFISPAALTSTREAEGEEQPPQIQTPIKSLVARLNGLDVSDRAAAVDGLSKRGAEAVFELIHALRNGDALTCHNATFVLGQMGPPFETVEALSHVLTGDQAWWVRCCAAWTLGLTQSGPVTANVVIKELKAALNDPDRGVRAEAASSLSSLAKSGRIQTKCAQAEQILTLLVNKAIRLSCIGRTAEAVACSNEVLDHFGTRREAGIAEQVARALLNKGNTLADAGNHEEGIAVYDDVVRRFGERSEAGIADQVACALLNKGNTLADAGDHEEEEIAVYGDVVRRFGERSEPGIAQLVAKALVVKGNAFGDIGDRKQARVAYDDVVRRFGERPEAGFAREVAKALVNVGWTLTVDGEHVRAIAVCDDVVRRFGKRSEAAIAAQVAKALEVKGSALADIGNNKQAIAAYDDVVRRFGKRSEAGIAQKVARALVNKGVTLRKAGDREELAVFDEVVCRFGERSEAGIAQQVARALFNKGLSLLRDGHAKEAIRPLQQLLGKVSTAYRIEAVDLLSYCGPEAIRDLIPLLSDKDAEICIHAADGLGRIKDIAAIPALKEVFHASNPELCRVAAEALAEIAIAAQEPVNDVVSTLIRVRDTHPDPIVQAQASQDLTRIQPAPNAILRSEGATTAALSDDRTEHLAELQKQFLIYCLIAELIDIPRDTSNGPFARANASNFL